MIKPLATSLVVLALMSCRQVIGGEGKNPEAPLQQVPHSFNPAGGWHPYGGGLFHWWNPHCFPCESAPDDYCRKPLPRLCWPSYPHSYIWGPSHMGYPGTDGFRDSHRSR
jgi:hypothetical protein